MYRAGEIGQQVIEANPWIGEPTGPEQVCGADRKVRFREYKGRASIYYSPNTGAHLIYILIQHSYH